MSRVARWVVGVGATLALVNHAPAADPAGGPLQPRFDPQFVLAQVAQRMGVMLRPEIAPPAVFLESTTPIGQFRDAIGAQWGFRPHAFGNAYAIERNEIYLIDDPSYYVRLGRTIDESLAHELAHFVQVKYLNADLLVPAWEHDAVVIQAWFRDAHVRDRGAALAR